MARILVIDDEQPIRDLLKKALEKAGHGVEVAPNGKVGIEIQHQHPADLVITDLFMPEKEGLETIMELKRDFPDIKIIAISGGDRKGTLDFLPMSEKLGAHIAMKKPFTISEVLEAVNNLLG